MSDLVILIGGSATEASLPSILDGYLRSQFTVTCGFSGTLRLFLRSKALDGPSLSSSMGTVIEVPHRRVKATLAISLVVFSVVSQFLPVRAAGTLTISPTRTLEVSASGVTLVLTVKGVVGGKTYTDYWAVSDLPDSAQRFSCRRWTIRNRDHGQTVLPTDPSRHDQSCRLQSQ